MVSISTPEQGVTDEHHWLLKAEYPETVELRLCNGNMLLARGEAGAGLLPSGSTAMAFPGFRRISGHCWNLLNGASRDGMGDVDTLYIKDNT